VTDAAMLAVGNGPAPPDEPSAHAMFRILDARIRVISASVGLLRQWSTVYGAFLAPPGPADITVAISSASDTEEPRPGEVAVVVGNVVRLWTATDDLFPPLWAPPLDRWLHLKGTAVGRAGQAVLLLAEPSAAKTLLTVATVARGAWLLSDELVPVDPDDLLVAPFPKALRLDREALELLAVDPAHPALVPFRAPAGRIEWRAEADALLGSRRSRVAAAASAMVFLEPNGANHKPRLQPLRPREALARLAAHLYRIPADLQAGTDALVRLCDQTPAYAFRSGPPEVGARLLEETLLG
jgi:hypothetical protein